MAVGSTTPSRCDVAAHLGSAASIASHVGRVPGGQPKRRRVTALWRGAVASRVEGRNQRARLAVRRSGNEVPVVDQPVVAMFADRLAKLGNTPFIGVRVLGI